MKTKLTTAQLDTVLYEVCNAARQLEHLGRIIVDETNELQCSGGVPIPTCTAADLSDRLEAFGMSIQFIAQRVGWLADMAIEGPGVMGGAADWMLPAAFHRAADKAAGN